jgi:hypothetical protein
MSHSHYQGTRERSFGQALIHLLEGAYGLLGSRRVLALLAEDIQELVEQFYPPPERLASGWMVFTGTRASGEKAYPGQKAGEHELVTLAWPLLLAEDLHELVEQAESRAGWRAWFRQRLVRLVEYGQQHPQGPVLLTTADLGAMLGLTHRQVSDLLAEARKQTGKALPTKGYYFDQGVRPTHKAEVIALYEAGLDEAEIARRSRHAADSVGRYIRDYERVKLLLGHGTALEHIPVLTGLRPSVVKAYAKMVAKYHPERDPEPGQAG